MGMETVLPNLEENVEFRDLYRSPIIVRLVKCRRLRWAGHVARMQENKECIHHEFGVDAP
jgi:hypothetical protein